MNEPESTKIRTLIADDEESFLSVLASTLESTDRFEITACESGEQATQALARASFDLVILDHKMPGISGLNVLQWMHEQKLETPVIMLTGAGSENIAVEAMKLGAYDYVRKDQFDRRHFPITAAAVVERFTFRKDKERRESQLQQQATNLSSLESLHQSIQAMGVNINSALSTISVITKDTQALLQNPLDPGSKEQFQSSLADLDGEFQTVRVIAQSIVELTRLVIDRAAKIAASLPPEKDLIHNTDLPNTARVPLKTQESRTKDAR